MILCCGEALIDMIPAQTEAGRPGFVPHSGGAVFNTAISLGRLGTPTGFLTGLSNDFFGGQLARDLRDSGVATDLAIRSDLPTTLAFVQLTDGHATYTFYDENTAGRMLSPDALPAIPAHVEAIYFGGISLISEPCADFYAALAEREAGHRTVILDPNIRPGFIKDETRYRTRLQRMIAVADVVKVSDEDLDWILPGEAGLEEKTEKLQLAGPAVVIVTRGSEGALGRLRGATTVHVPARKATVVDTVGAGDTFNAGFMAELAGTGLLAKPRLAEVTPSQVEQALARGAAIAAVTVSRAGANPPWAHELAV